MNPKYHLLAAVATLSLGACSTDDTCTGPENAGYKLSFSVAEDSETRTTLDAGDILRWVPTDKVGIYTVGQNVNPNIMTVADVDQSPVEFIGDLKKSVSPGDLFYAYYPYNAAQSTDPKAVKLSIPVEQKQTAAGVYNGETHPLVAVPMELSGMQDSYDYHMSSVRFRQLGAIVELQLFSSDEALHNESIRSVTFEADTPLAGDFSFDLTAVTIDKEPTIAGYESKAATTILEEPAAIPAAGGEAARVYLTIAPGRYAGQIVVKTDVAKYTFRLVKAMTFERAVIKGLPADLAKVERIVLSPDDLVEVNYPIHFEDPTVEEICLANWDTNGDGELSYKEAAAVTLIGTRFEAKSIRSFNELRYFTGLQSIGGYAFSRCSSLTSIDIPEGVTTIGYRAFEGCNSLTNINIPDGVTTIEVCAFHDCSSLTSINIPNGVTTIGGDAFRGCSSLTSIHIPDGVTTIVGGAFRDCSNLTNINIPDGVTTISDFAFSCCSSLTSINIPNGVTEIGSNAFEGCSSLTNINIPDGVTAISDFAFSWCSSLTNINIPDGVTTIGNFAFSLCSSLTSINIPNGVTEIGGNAFQSCSSLKSINIPDGVTEIRGNTFMNCHRLKSINIPNGVTTIGESAFEDCSSLTSVYCKPITPPTIGYRTFYKTSSSMKIYVPAASIGAYKTAARWSSYASQIL